MRSKRNFPKRSIHRSQNVGRIINVVETGVGGVGDGVIDVDLIGATVDGPVRPNAPSGICVEDGELPFEDNVVGNNLNGIAFADDSGFVDVIGRYGGTDELGRGLVT